MKNKFCLIILLGGLITLKSENEENMEEIKTEKNKINSENEKDVIVTEEFCKKSDLNKISLNLKKFCEKFKIRINNEAKKIDSKLNFFDHFTKVLLNENKNYEIDFYKNFKELFYIKNAKWKSENVYEKYILKIPDYLIDNFAENK